MCDLGKSLVRSRAKTLRCQLFVLAILYAVVGAAGSARAEDAPNTRSQKLFAAALDAKRAGDLPRALCLMQRAHSAWPNAAFSFNVAQLQRELGMCADARANYQAFLEHERDAARRKQAQLALAELVECQPRAAPSSAASSCDAWEAAALRDNAGVKETDSPLKRDPRVELGHGDAPRPATIAAAVGGGPSGGGTAESGEPNARALPAPSSKAASSANDEAPTPREVARAHVTPRSPPLIAAPIERPPGPKRGVRQYLPWILAGIGVACVAVSGFELAQMLSAQRDLGDGMLKGDAYTTRKKDGSNAQTLAWVFGAGATLSFGTALVLALTDGDDPPPSAAAR